MRKQKVAIYDTTLRDGNQAIGIGFSLEDKLTIAKRLDKIGVKYIEGGWPNPTNKIDVEFYKEIEKFKFKAKIAVFGSTRRPKIKADDDEFLKTLVKTGAHAATIFGKSWDLHVTKVIRCSLDENIDMIFDSIKYLKSKMSEVIYDAEHFFDGYKANPEYAIKTLLAAEKAGADVIVLCDTNGGTMPGEYGEIFNAVKSEISTPLGVHNHNDAGCAVANSLIAVENGAIQVQGTMNGLGERTGNANLCTIIPAIQLKLGIKVISDKQLAFLTETSIYMSDLFNIGHDVRYPFVGEAAFSHKGGAHIDGVRKVHHSFEHIDPELVGNKRRFVLSDQSGTGTILEKLKNVKSNLDKKDPLVKGLLKRIKNMEADGYHFEAADGTFQLIVREELGDFEEPFTVLGFRVIEEKNAAGELVSEATIKVSEGNHIEHTAANGDGPVNALDNALRKALINFFPTIKAVKLEDFKVRVLAESEGTAAKVRVLIESSDGLERWGTVGVSTNIIEASWIALVDSLKYKLMKDKLKRTKERKTNFNLRK